MKVLLLGVTRKVGSQMLPALAAHYHKVVAYVVYVRAASKVGTGKRPLKLNSIIEGSRPDGAGIKAAIISQNCDAVVNTAGLAPFFFLSKKGQCWRFLPRLWRRLLR
jgi:nucleoside-diphosphate-sugar epimerase